MPVTLKLKFSFASGCPGDSAASALLYSGWGGGGAGVIVQANHDVTADSKLSADGIFGRENDFVLLFGASVGDQAGVSDFAEIGLLLKQGKNLKTARIRNSQALPGHEFFDTTPLAQALIAD